VVFRQRPQTTADNTQRQWVVASENAVFYLAGEMLSFSHKRTQSVVQQKQVFVITLLNITDFQFSTGILSAH